MTNMTGMLEEVFSPTPVPEWLLAFEADPVPSVHALLTRRFYFGHLNVAEPEELLADWALALREANGFVARLDEALEAWVDDHWGNLGAERPARLADAWSRLADTVTTVEELPRTARGLRRRFDECHEFLGPLSVAPSRDPLGRYLQAVAVSQEDRSLEAFWWRLADLPGNTPFYHARYAMAGLRGLPAAEEREPGGLRSEVVHGLARLARALFRLGEENTVLQARARDELKWTAQLTFAAFPFPEKWSTFLNQVQPPLPEGCKGWLSATISGWGGGSKHGGPTRPRRQNRTRRNTHTTK